MDNIIDYERRSDKPKTCKWTYVNATYTSSGYYKVECGSIDNLRYHSHGWHEVDRNTLFYSFVYCPFCGNKIERV